MKWEENFLKDSVSFERQQSSCLNFSCNRVGYKGVTFQTYRFKTIPSMLFFRLRWFRDQREETTDRHVLNHVCDSEWTANVILQKWDHSQSQGTDPISPSLLPAGASSLTVCLFRWLDQSLLSWLQKPLKGLSGFWATCIGGSHKEMEACAPTCGLLFQGPPSPHKAEAVLSLHPPTCIGNPGKKSLLRTKPNTALARCCL